MIQCRISPHKKVSTHIELSQVLIERLCRKCSTQPFFLHNTAWNQPLRLLSRHWSGSEYPPAEFGLLCSASYLADIAAKRSSEILPDTLSSYRRSKRSSSSLIRFSAILSAFSGSLHLTVLCRCGAFHFLVDKFFLIVPYKLWELVQFTEDNFGQHTSPDVVGSAFVRIVCIRFQESGWPYSLRLSERLCLQRELHPYSI